MFDKFDNTFDCVSKLSAWLLSLAWAVQVCVFAFAHTESVWGGIAASMFFVPLTLIPVLLVISPVSMAVGIAAATVAAAAQALKRARA